MDNKEFGKELEVRTKKFAISVIMLSISLPFSEEGKAIKRQLTKSGTSVGANFLGKQSQVNQQGSDAMLRQGVILDVAGMPMRESGQLGSHTAGTVSGTLASLVRAAGTTVLTTTADYSGTIVAGDVLTFAGDTNKYVVVSVSAAAITINEPGLVAGTTTGTKAITMVATHADNLAFNRGAIELAIRAPADPLGGDGADDVMMVQDPHSGLAFGISVYKGRKKAMIAVDALYGVKCWKPEHVALLMG